MDCFICGDNHYARECPFIGDVKSMIQQKKSASSSPAQSHHQRSLLARASTTAAVDYDLTTEHLAFAIVTSKVTAPVMCSDSITECGNDHNKSVLSTCFPASNAQYVLQPFDVLLDNQASMSVFHQKELMKNIRPTAESVTFHGISGSCSTNLIGEVQHFGTVRYMPTAVANILSLAEIEDRFDVQYIKGEAFVVHINQNLSYRFERKNNGLFVCDMSACSSTNHIVAMQTVAHNESMFTKREVDAARRAKRFIQELGYPSVADAIRMIQTGSITNAPVTAADIYRSYKIYGPDIASLKGKTKRARPSLVKVEHVPKPVVSDIILHVDLMFVKGEPYLVSVGMPLGLTMASYLHGQKTKSAVSAALNRQLMEYKGRHFKVMCILTDREGPLQLLPMIC